MASDLGSYAIAFVLTVLLEVAVALAFGLRRRPEIGAVVLVNVFSHPLLICLLWTIASLRATPIRGLEILMLEAGAVLVEWRLLCYAIPRHSAKRLFVLSLTMNAASYLSGMALSV
jgi:hypothetical protein